MTQIVVIRLITVTDSVGDPYNRGDVKVVSYWGLYLTTIILLFIPAPLMVIGSGFLSIYFWALDDASRQAIKSDVSKIVALLANNSRVKPENIEHQPFPMNIAMPFK